MSTCHCDGPPHPYDPSWCVRPRLDPPQRDQFPPRRSREPAAQFVPQPTGRARHRSDS